MTWTSSPASESDFVANHEWLSTSPESGFVQVPMAERRDATGVDVVRGLTRSRIGSGAFTGTPITRQAEWFDLVENLFDLPVHALPAEARERVWARVTEAHRVWEASRD
jgi:arylamine N-acetyltransferase